MSYRIHPQPPDDSDPFGPAASHGHADAPGRAPGHGQGHAPRRRGGKARGPSRRRRAARRTVQFLPTLCTLGNLIFGFGSVYLASRAPDTRMPFAWTPLTWAAICIFLGMFMDMLDGRVARLTRNTSDLGEQLDSMADMVTFGVAPAFLAVQLVSVATPYAADTRDVLFSESSDVVLRRVTFAVAAIYAACTALRLARFNVEIERPEEADHGSFKGLPSPGAAGTVASLVLLHQHFGADYQRVLTAGDRLPSEWPMWTAAVTLVAVMALVAFAMVSKLRYVHAANRYLRGRLGLGKLAAVAVVLTLFALQLQWTLAVAFTVYAVSAPASWLVDRLRGAGSRPPSLVKALSVDMAGAHPAPHASESPAAHGREDGGAGRRDEERTGT